MSWVLRQSIALVVFWVRDWASVPPPQLTTSSRGVQCLCGEGMLPYGCIASLLFLLSSTALFNFLLCCFYFCFLFLFVLFVFGLFVFVLHCWFVFFVLLLFCVFLICIVCLYSMLLLFVIYFHIFRKKLLYKCKRTVYTEYFVAPVLKF